VSGVLRRSVDTLPTPGEKRNLIAALRQTDPDAAPEPTRGADHHRP
jgi:hypothetical protein